MQPKELADRSGRALLVTGGGPTARPLVGAREEVQVGSGVEPSVNMTAKRRLCEADKAAPAEIWKAAVQPASGRAKRGREVLLGEQVRPRQRIEELPNRAGSQVFPVVGREAPQGWRTSGLKTNSAQFGRWRTEGGCSKAGALGQPLLAGAPRGAVATAVCGASGGWPGHSPPRANAGESGQEPRLGSEGEEAGGASFSELLSQVPPSESSGQRIRGASTNSEPRCSL